MDLSLCPPTQSTSCTFANLQSSTKYEIRLRAKNEIGLSSNVTYSIRSYALPLLGLSDALNDTPSGYDVFGSSMVYGDFNDDKYEDLIVGIPGREVAGAGRAGALAVFYGTADGMSTDNALFISQNDLNSYSRSDDHAETDDRFGSSLSVGDFNADGFDDLVVGAPGESVGSTSNAGAVHIIYGSSSGLAIYENPSWRYRRDQFFFQGVQII